VELRNGEFRTACRGCHGGCIHIVTVEDGKVVRVRPDHSAPLNIGRACAKGISIIEQMYHPDRLTRPLKRVGERGSGRFEPISWDEALDTIAGRLNELREKYGPECISAITGTGRHHVPYLWRFTRAIGTPNITSAGALICLGPRKNAGFSTSGIYNSVDYYGDKKPECIVVWGANPTTSGADGELQWHPRICAQRGTKFIVIDPQKTKLAEKADLWLRIRPGTDGALALCFLNIIIEEGLYDKDFVENWCYGFEELRERCREYDVDRVSRITWIPKEQIIAAARMMATVKPMSLEWGCAFEQGANATQTCRAIYMLPAITGNYDVPGGFVESKQIVPTKRDPEEPAPNLLNRFPYRSLKPYANPRQVLNAIRTGKPYKIRAMIGSANNSLISLPDSRHVYECMKELEFFVYIDVFMTPTASLADIILPAALWPELECVFTMPEFCEHTVLCQQKLVQVGECRSDEEIFLDICKRMGVDYGAESHREILEEALRVMAIHKPEMEGLSFDKLSERGYFTPKREYYNYKRRGGFNTPTGKFELYSMEIKNNGGDPLPFWQEPPETIFSRPELAMEYPYIMSTGSRRLQYFISNNRQIRSLRRTYPFPLVKMHPDTARENGISEGDWVYIETPRGRITQKAKLEKDMDKRVINCDFAWWYPEAGAPGYGWDESNANILTSDSEGVDSYMGSYQLRGILCKVYKNENCHIEERYYKSAYWEEFPPDQSSDSVMIDHSKCVLCGECVRICRDVQGVGALEIVTRNGVTMVRAKGGGTMSGSNCVGCGQCRNYCAEDALRVKSDLERLEEALGDENSFVAVQIAPSVRVGVEGRMGFEKGENTVPKLVGALRNLGFDRVYDTVLSADLTVIEEAEEFLARLEKGGKLPLLTSCCPAWVKFCEDRWPQFAGNISSCRSPQQMLGALMREHNRLSGESGGKKYVSVSVMPCTAKKKEIQRPDSHSFGERDVDISITTVELLELLERRGINAEGCPESIADAPFSGGSGGGSLFGGSGGVTMAVLRYLGSRLGEIKVESRDEGGYVCHEVSCGELKLRAAVVSGLRKADELMKKIASGEESFQLVEVMACTGGCVMGGGQPADVYDVYKDRAERSAGLRRIDEASAQRSSEQNALLRNVYDNIVKGRQHELLHCER